MLRVGTGRKALRAVGGRFFKLWESKGEINRPEHTAGGSQNKGTEKLQRRSGPSPLEVGGGGGERGKLSPREATPSHPANRPRVLSEDFLRPDRRRTLGPQREGARRACGESAKPLAARAVRRRGKRRSASVERAPNLWLPEPLAAEGKGAQYPGRGRLNLWPPGLPAAGGKGAPHPGRGSQNFWLPGQNTASAPHSATSACSAPPSPQQD